MRHKNLLEYAEVIGAPPSSKRKRKRQRIIALVLSLSIILPLCCFGAMFIAEKISLLFKNDEEPNYFADDSLLSSYDFTDFDDYSDDMDIISHGNLSDYINQFAAKGETVITYSGEAGACPYPEDIENNDGAIQVMSYYSSLGTQFINLDNGGQIRNVTSLSNADILKESRLLPQFKIEYNSEPQVLIMHTHTTESYEPYLRDFYDSSFVSRTTDESKNVISVGNEIEKQLKDAGINVIHDTTIHDYPSYNGSYDRSAVTVKAILEQYPSIKIVLDIHRDAIEKEDGTRVAPSVDINGKSAAQVMIISGCDNGKFSMPNYMQNLRFSSLLQQQMETDYSGLTRPILFDYRKYNQDLTTGSILIEVGSHGNSIEQAQYTGELVGKSLVKALEKLS